MSGKIPRQFINELLMRVDIVDLIDSHHPLKKTGSNYMARCPFHEEKTPSFSVNRNKQIYHCFGCGASGNAIGFLMDFNHLGFVEAIEDLAAFVGIDVPREAASTNTPLEKPVNASIYAVLDGVAAFYTQQLKMSREAEVARNYLQQRGVDAAVIERFGLGYAPNQWDELLKRFSQQSLLDAGLLVQHESGRCYDRFRGRLMFPIRDRRKRVIGFGGRVLDDSQPKYLNSPETAAFSKSQELYGLCELLEKHNKPPRILLVEGYMDVIALAQFGINYAVAALGTATSKTHLEQLFRFSSEIVLCFDGDSAGRQAAWRAMEVIFPCLRDGRQVKIMLLPQGEDPDSLVRQEGMTSFETRIANAQILSSYFFTTLSEPLNLAVPEGQSQLANKAKPYLEKMPNGIFKDLMLKEAARLSHVILDVSANATKLKAQTQKRDQRGEKIISMPRRLVALLLQNPQLAQILAQQDCDWQGLDFPGATLFKNIARQIESSQAQTTAMLLELYRNTTDERAVNALAKLDLAIPEGGEVAEFLGALECVIRQAREQQLELLMTKERSVGLAASEKEQLNALLKNNT